LLNRAKRIAQFGRPAIDISRSAPVVEAGVRVGGTVIVEITNSAWREPPQCATQSQSRKVQFFPTQPTRSM
jgi:hypothetical protein